MNFKPLTVPVIHLAVILSAINTHAFFVLTFDPPSIVGGSKALSTYTEQGVIFSGSLDRSFSHTDTMLDNRPDSGSAHLNVTRLYTHLDMGGQLFDLLEVDLAEYSTVYTSPKRIGFVGHRLDHSTVETEFITDGIIDGSGPIVDFERFVFPSSFTNLQYVTFPDAIFAMDNLVMQTIPEPSSTTLVIAALVIFSVRNMKTYRTRNASTFNEKNAKNITPP